MWRVNAAPSGASLRSRGAGVRASRKRSASPAGPAGSAGKRSGRALIGTEVNGCLLGASLALSAVQWWVLPLWLLPRAPAWIGAPALVLCILAAPWQWAVLHESIHGLLLPGARLNEAAGRLLGIAFGAPFDLLRFGHLAHHRFNRCEADRPEVYDPARTSRLRAAVQHMLRLLGGTYLGSVAAAGLSFAPRPAIAAVIRRSLREITPAMSRLRRQALQQLAERRLGALRMDTLAAWLVLAAGMAAYGERWAVGLAVFYGRAVLVSLLDNSYHYGTPLDGSVPAVNLGLPAGLGPWLLYTNLHRVHHRHPHVPWRCLPRWEPREAVPDFGFLAGLARQFKGPIPLGRLPGAPAPGAGPGASPA